MSDRAYEGFPIEQLIPKGMALTDIQRNYLEAVAFLFSQKDHVKMIDVARLMGKPTGSVHSAMMTLNRQGILETNHSGDIYLLREKAMEHVMKEDDIPNGVESEVSKPSEEDLQMDDNPGNDLTIQPPAAEEKLPGNSLVDGYTVIDGQIVDSNGSVIPDAPYTALHLSVRPFNVFTRERDKIKANNHETLMVSDLLKLSMEQLAGLRNLGAKSIPEIIEELKRYLSDPARPAAEPLLQKEPALKPEPVMEPVFAADYEIVDRVIRHKQSAAIIANAPIQALGLNIRNQAALLVNGFQKITDLIHVEFKMFRERTGLGNKSTRDIADQLDEYLKLHQEFYGQAADSEVIVTPAIIMDFFAEHEFDHVTKDEIASVFEGADEAILNNLLEKLVNEEKLICEGETYYKYHRSFFQYAFTTAMDDYPKLKSDYLDVLRWRSLGNTLEEVGRSRGMTRERVRQIEQKTLDILTERKKIFFTEDAYAYLFQTYEMDRDAFVEGLKLPQQTWYYLIMRYERGKKPLSEGLEDQSLSVEIRYAIEKYIHRNDLCIEGRYIPCTRIGVEKYLLERFCRDEMAFEDFVALCDRFIEEHNLPVEEETTTDPDMLEKARINRLSRTQNVLWKQNQRLRYYNIEGEDFSELLEAINLPRYRNIEISTLKILNDYPEIMQRYDIRDEYELHNLLKKIHAEKENPTLTFGRMPGLVFGTFDRDEAVKEIMFALAPVNQEDLVEMIHLEYGFRKDTVQGGWLKCISEYLHQGMYSIEYQDMPADQMEAMKAVLTDDFYTFDEMKELYLRSVENPDLTLLSSYNLKRLGFNAGTSYFIRSTISAETYFDHLLTDTDRVDITEYSRRFVGLTTFSSCLARQRHDLNMLEYEPYRYVNIRMLEKSGFGKERLKAYDDRVWEYVQNHKNSNAVLISKDGQDEYFTVVSLKNAGFMDELDMLGFGDMFYASILREDERFSWQKIGKMTVFNTRKVFFKTQDFLSAYVDQQKSVDVPEMAVQLGKCFGIDLDRSKIMEKIDKETIYYDPVMDRLHADYAVFVEASELFFRMRDNEG